MNDIADEMTSASRHVLVVEDDDDVRALAVELFEELGFVVHAAASGPEALTLLAAQPKIGVLFSDVRMPGMNGMELAHEALKRAPDLRVVLTSAYVGGTTVADVDFLPKPYRMNDLARTLGAAASPAAT
jgi:CheY-like chemotaxis protein